MNAIHFQQIKSDIVKTIKSEAYECSKRAITAVAIAAILGTFGIHAGIIGTARLFWLAKTVTSKVLFISSLASIQYLVEKVASKILHKVVSYDSYIARDFKFYAPYLLSIASSFAFCSFWGQFNGFPLGMKIDYENSGWYEIKYVPLENWKEAFYPINLAPQYMTRLDRFFTYELKTLTDVVFCIAQGAANIASQVAQTASRTHQTIKQYFFTAA